MNDLILKGRSPKQLLQLTDAVIDELSLGIKRSGQVAERPTVADA